MNNEIPKLHSAQWVSSQYKTSNNLNARIQLHRRFSTNPQSWLEWVFDRLALKPGMTVLEIGGGPGGLWQENRARLPGPLAVTYSDFSVGMVAEASALLGDLPHFRFAAANAMQLPFAGESFDVVIANHMLYHVPDRSKALAEARRVLRADGRFFAATNDRAHMQEVRDLAHTFMPGATQMIPANERFPFDVATAEISQVFGQVQLHRFHNSLAVTDADALADYMLSGFSLNLPVVAQTPFRLWLHERLAVEKVFTITSAAGMFEASSAVEEGQV
jgi:ubiquinone/menaquinone biosynthesis C-methylase UbiE